jgi:hypothetical protein
MQWAGFGLVTTNALFKLAHYREQGYNLGAGQRSDVPAFGCDTGLRADVKVGSGYGWREPSRAEQASHSRSHQGHPAMYIGVFDWWREHFGRPEDQPVILAVVLVLIAITLYVFL